MLKTYHIDQSIRSRQWKIDSFKNMRLFLYWFGPLILLSTISTSENKWVGVLIFSIIPTTMALVFYLRQLSNPLYEELIITINYQTGDLIRNDSESFNINEFGRIICHKEGIKLFKRGYHSWISYLSNHSNLNTRSYHVFIPCIMEDFEEIKGVFKKKGWL